MSTSLETQPVLLIKQTPEFLLNSETKLIKKKKKSQVTSLVWSPNSAPLLPVVILTFKKLK